MIGEPGTLLLSAPYREETVSNFEERNEQAERIVSMGIIYVTGGVEQRLCSANHIVERTGELSMLWRLFLLFLM